MSAPDWAALADVRTYHGRNGRTVQAVQLTPDNLHRVGEWAPGKPYYAPGLTITGYSVFAGDGQTRYKAEFGDWIVRYPSGKYRPVPADAFTATYTPAPDSPGGQ